MGMVVRRRGITVIELVIVLAIVAILTVLVVPNLGGWVQHYRIKGVVRHIVSQMELAKIKALKNNLEYRVYFDKTIGTFELQRGNRPAMSPSWIREAGPYQLPRQVTMSVTFASDAVQFNPHGTAGSGRVVLATPHNEKYTITVTTSTGKINTHKGEIE